MAIIPRAKNSWPKAFWLFLHDKKAPGLLLHVVRPLAVAYLPLGILGDLLFPPLALIDGIPTVLVAAYVLWRVNKYRYVATLQNDTAA